MKKNLSKALFALCFSILLFCGFDSTSLHSPTIYPLQFDSSLEDYVTEMPDICYKTPASENGLSGNVYSVTGLMYDVIPEEETPDGVPTVFSVMTDTSLVYFAVMDPDFMARSTGTEFVQDLFDNTMDYTLPNNGDYVTIYGIYSGYSNTYDGPLLYFGLDEYVRDCVIGNTSGEMFPPTPTQKSPTTAPSSSVPLVTYEDILTGAYNGQIVSIEAVIDNIYNASFGSCDFTLWYPWGTSYFHDDGSFSDPNENPAEKVFSTASNGDVIRFSTQIYDDGSFGTVDVYSAEIVGNVDISQVRSAYKDNCPEMNYEDILRNPDSYKGQSFKTYGTIFQIINEGDYSAEYLLETSSGYIYLSWYQDKEVRGSRFLEGDSVVVCGEFQILKTYDTLVAENTVPNLSVSLIELM